MQKWEYATNIFDSRDLKEGQSYNDLLNAYGLKGWELVSLSKETFDGRFSLMVCFKRPMTAKEQAVQETRAIKSKAQSLARDILKGNAPLEEGAFKQDPKGPYKGEVDYYP